MTQTDFGWSSNADDSHTPYADRIRFIYGTSSVSGNLHSFWLRADNDWSSSEYARGAIYISSTKEIVAQSTLMKGKGEIIWISGSFGPSGISKNTDYIIAAWDDENAHSTYTDNAGDKDYLSTTSKDFSASGNGDFSKYFNPLNTALFSKFTSGIQELFISYTPSAGAILPPYPESIYIISSNGCYKSSQTTATISSQVYGGSGTVTYVWGNNDAGTSSINDWDNSVKDGTIRYTGDEFKYQITDGLSPEHTYYTRTYISSNWFSNTEDWSNLTTFITLPLPINNSGNVWIFYSGNRYPRYAIGSWCSRWDEDEWGVVYETFLTSSQRDALFTHIVPGAVKELYNILGTPKYIDSTFSSGNTLILEPQHDYGISSIREKRTIGVKNITDWIIPHTNRIGVKIEGIRLDIE